MKIDNDNFIVRKIAGKDIIIPLHNKIRNVKNLFILDETSKLILDLLNKNKNESEIIKELISKHSNKYQKQIKVGVKTAIKEFKRIGIII